MAPVATKANIEIRPHLWNREEFYRLLDLGFFQEKRVELIEGEILEKASQKNFHAIGIGLTEEALRLAFGPPYWVRVQMSLDLTPYSVPDPDLAVILGTIREANSEENPTSALLLVEVSETTYFFDRDRKGSLYALAGIEDYWILNLKKKRLEVYRQPGLDEKKYYQHGYKEVEIYEAGQTVSPLVLPEKKIKVEDLLP
jgi:Uma2 family endonuclease